MEGVTHGIRPETDKNTAVSEPPAVKDTKVKSTAKARLLGKYGYEEAPGTEVGEKKKSKYLMLWKTFIQVQIVVVGYKTHHCSKCEPISRKSFNLWRILTIFSKVKKFREWRYHTKASYRFLAKFYNSQVEHPFCLMCHKCSITLNDVFFHYRQSPILCSDCRVAEDLKSPLLLSADGWLPPDGGTAPPYSHCHTLTPGLHPGISKCRRNGRRWRGRKYRYPAPDFPVITSE